MRVRYEGRFVMGGIRYTIGVRKVDYTRHIEVSRMLGVGVFS